MRPFKNVYHPFSWRGWFDFGNGGLADFCCHAINLPMRALDLGYPERLVVNMQDGKQTPGKPALEFHFAARGNLVPLTLSWQGDGTAARGRDPALGRCLQEERARRHHDRRRKGPHLYQPLEHGRPDPPGRRTAIEGCSAPRCHEGHSPDPAGSKGHGQEWIDACRGEGKTFSDFDIGGKLTEIGLAGIVAIRTGKSLDWNGEKMEAANAPEAARFVRTEYRTKWLT